MSDAAAPKLARRFRVGLLDARDPDAPDAAARLVAVLRVIAAKLDAAAAEAARRADPPVHDGPGFTRLLVTALATPTERAVARAALAEGWRLSLRLPCAREAWLQQKGCADACDLLEGAELFALDGETEPARKPAGEADAADRAEAQRQAALAEAQRQAALAEAQRSVVRHADALLVLAESEEATLAAPGGLVRFAARIGPPLLLLGAQAEGAPRLIEEVEDLRRRRVPPEGEDPLARLEALIQQALVPPEAHPHPHGITAWLVGKFRRHPASMLADFASGEIPPARPVWGAYFAFIERCARAHRAVSALWNRLRGKPAKALAEPAPRAEAPAARSAVEDHWDAIHARADRLAVAYADRYRSTFCFVFALAALALVIAILAIAFAGAPTGVKIAFGIAELLVLVVLFGLVCRAIAGDWHERFIAFRLLAELCRKQKPLALLGWSILPWQAAAGQDAKHPPPNAWVAWYFAAALRAAPAAPSLDRPAVKHAFAVARGGHLVGGQARYHDERAHRSADAGAFLGLLGEAFFFAAVLSVLLKLLVLAWDGPKGLSFALGIAAALLPALSAGLLGIRSYAELRVQEEASRRMARVMAAAEERLGELEPTIGERLASQQIALAVGDIANEMLSETRGWAELFRLKAIEPG